MFKIIKKDIQFGDHTLTLETGKIARQANSVTARMGDTVVLACVVVNSESKTNADFLALTVHYMEKYYAAGKFPGGFFKRENRPTEREVLISRIIDRSIRPLFLKGLSHEVQVTVTLLSHDPAHQPDVVAIAATCAAIMLSGLPFDGPVCASRVGYKNSEFVLNPPAIKVSKSDQLDLVVAGTADAVLMVESEAMELSEEVMLKAVKFAHDGFASVIEGINHFISDANVKPIEVSLSNDDSIVNAVNKLVGKKLTTAYKNVQKQARNLKIAALKDEVIAHFADDAEIEEAKVKAVFKVVQSNIVRELALGSKLRIDGRGLTDIRQIVAETDILPRTHGSALFTRGETQALVITTLGSGDDEQMVDDIEGVRKDRFMLHYNFPHYSVGETGRVGAPGRREIGHGKLAFRSLNALMPTKEEFPYTIRVVSEITESNGSSSMATVCGSSLSLMAAGVPLRSPIAGIAMGLIKEDERFVVLSDIMGDEDFLGDMDFKVAGTNEGITALQMDIKIKGITEEIMQQALDQAKVGRIHILERMADALDQSRLNISKNAPQINSFKIPKEKIGELIGPGGKMIKSIIEQTGVKIDISDDGTVNISSTSDEGMQAALALVNDIIAVPEIGKIYDGKVVKVTDFGAFVGIMKNCEGLVHVSEMANHQVKHPRDVVSEGQKLKVKVLDIDKLGRVKLSMKAVKANDEGGSSNPEAPTENAASSAQESGEDSSENSVQIKPSNNHNNKPHHHKKNNQHAPKNNNAPIKEASAAASEVKLTPAPLAAEQKEDESSDRQPNDNKNGAKKKFKHNNNKSRNERPDGDNKARPSQGEKKLRFF